MREQEWSLVDRDSLLLGRPLLEAFLATPLADSLPGTQRSLAEALTSSFAGAFRVVERDGSSAVFEELTRGRRIEVHEHNPGAEYEAGTVGLGRVCPFDGPVHLRSPGMAFLPQGEDSAQAVKDRLRVAPRALPPAVRVETVLAALLGREELPRDLPPAASPRQAREFLQALAEALEEAGLAEEVSKEEADIELAADARARGARELTYRRYDIDRSTGAWMRSLMQHASPPRGGRQKGRPGRKARRRG